MVRSLHSFPRRELPSIQRQSARTPPAGLPRGNAPAYRAQMFGQLDSLQRVFDSLLQPIEDRLERFVPNDAARGSDPVWQLGHAAFDASYALLRPFAPDHALLLRFGDVFHGRHVGDPWHGNRPAYADVRDWWKNILVEGRRTLAEQGLDAPLPAPVVFTAYSVGTTSEACDYVLFHTSFHLGRAYELLRSPAPADELSAARFNNDARSDVLCHSRGQAGAPIVRA